MGAVAYNSETNPNLGKIDKAIEVQPGNTIWGIATEATAGQKNSNFQEELYNLEQEYPNGIQPGQIIVLPDSSKIGSKVLFNQYEKSIQTRQNVQQKQYQNNLNKR